MLKLDILPTEIPNLVASKAAVPIVEETPPINVLAGYVLFINPSARFIANYLHPTIKFAIHF